MTLYRNKYRIHTARLPRWDYASAAWYFVTVCTRDRARFLGEVVEHEMRLSQAGGIVAEEWLQTASVRTSVTLDTFIVMPNHIHGIIVLAAPSGETPRRGVSTPSRLRPGSLGSIMGQFRGACTRRIWHAGLRDFGWQPRFYDHVIRDERSLNEIREYIRNNPLKWDLDKDNIENLNM